MATTSHEVQGVRIFELVAEGKKLRTRRDATDVMSEVFSLGSEGVRMLAIPIARLDEDFFRLKTGVAGEIVPRFVGYGMRAAFVGDISQHVAASESFRDFVREANRGKDFGLLRIWMNSTGDLLNSMQRRRAARHAEGERTHRTLRKKREERGTRNVNNGTS